MRVARVPLGFFFRRGFAAGNGRARGQAQPTDEVTLGWQGRQVQAGLGEDDLRGAGADPVDSGQVDPGKAP